MNRVAGIIGTAASLAERELSLSNAFYCSDAELKVIHPFPDVTLGWNAKSSLVAFANNSDLFVMVYGSAYARNHGNVRVDNISSAAELLLKHELLENPFQSELAGSFIGFMGNRDGHRLLFGDPTGNRGPYFLNLKKELVFASHPLVCARLSGITELDRDLEDFLLIYGFLPEGRTAYRDVRLLGAGKLLSYSKGDCSEQNVGIIAQNSPAITQPNSDNELYDQLYEVLLSCTNDQLTTHGEVGVFLGGFDSALIAALLHRLGKRVRTYSFYYADTEYNQPHTDTLAAFLDCEHTWVNITPEVISKGLENYAEQYVQPTNWLNYLIQTTCVCERMRRNGIEYAYSGDGCDAIFLGYPGTYKRTYTFSRLPKLPGFLVSALIEIFSRPALDRRIGHPYRVAMSMLRATAMSMPARAFLTFRVMDETTVRALRLHDKPTHDETLESMVDRLAQSFNGCSIQRLGYAAKGFVSPNRAKLLACADVAGVSVHSPYMHPELRDFVAGIPDHMLREQSQNRLEDPGKICLMRMAERHHLLPVDVIYQTKLAAIDSPIDDWLESELRPSLDRALSGLPFKADPRQIDALTKRTWAEQLYKRHVGSTRVISDAISLLATYGAICGALTKTTPDR